MTYMSPPLFPAPEHVRAARALLAWSQADLARAASVAVSTVADFERGLRTPVVNNAQAMKDAIEAQGISFLPGGAVVTAKIPSPAFPKPGKPMRWIEAQHLVQWAGTRDGQAKLPELISRLLLATHGPAAMLRFPSDDSIQHPGWDGICDAPTASPYVPAGITVWEIGVQRGKVLSKAEEDYLKRSTDPLEIDPAQSCFIFVTPQRWPQKDAWAAEKKQDGVWRDVRVIDGDMLVHWLELYPSVAEWLAVRIQRRPEGLRGLDSIWREWSLATVTPLSSNLITADRDDQAAKVLAWIYGPPAIISLQAEASGEAMAFVAGALAALPEPYRVYWTSRILAVQSENVARHLVGLGPKLAVILDRGDPGLAAALVADGHHVLRAFGSDVGAPRDVIRLARPWRHHAERELEAMGLEREEAHRLALQSGRSLVVLRRLMTASPAGRPSWAATPIDPALLAAMLAGGWRDDHPVDREVLERLSGLSYDALVAALALYTAAFDGPVRRSGTAWRLASLRDAWFQLAPFLTDGHLDRLNVAFLGVMGERDPAFDAKPEDRWKTDREPPKIASPDLRNGLGEAMVALGMFPERASAASTAKFTAHRNISALLEKADDRLWWSLSDSFRLLSEAAPQAFFDSVDAALDREPSPMAALFRSDEGFIHPQEYLSDLLWSLELHAWSPRHLSTVSLLLARLADRDPGGRLANRPKATLQRIFLPWVPQTYATSEQRLQVIDLVLKRYNRVGWELLLGIAPSMHGFSTPSASPRWRDYTVDSAEPVTRLGIARAYEAIGERVLAHVGKDTVRWGELLEHWANFKPAWREAAAAKLAAAAPAFDSAGVADFREKLRGLIAKHEKFAGADWAMEAAALAPLKIGFASLEPNDPAARHAWLFTRGNHHFRRNLSWEEAGKRLADEQRIAAAELAGSLSVDALVDYALTLQMPDALGAGIVAADIAEDRKDAILYAALARGEPRSTDMAQRMTFALAEVRGATWLWARFDAAVRAGRPPSEIVPLMMALPVEPHSWDRVAGAGAAIDAAYWRAIGTFRVPEGPVRRIAVEKLLAENRGRSALEMLIGPTEHAGDAADLLAVLRHPSTVSEEKAQADDNDPVMFSYYVGEAFERLDADDGVGEDEIRKLEWIYFHALQHSERPVRTLHKALSSNPAFFVQLLHAVFGRIELEPDDAESRRCAQLRSHVAAHPCGARTDRG
ncbi:helix-turn-helix domain-containing protein [Ancylobacter amanitiformis]|uniref:DNA-binding XRE family transcriptional regulator n=1 Tax=Ancylobacter amanitiformis TaxID=217069 RepID=A0ABU0LXG4_9HYPH|nr:helix-turn-helix transcriptional regulator [Ancylobacter amanitiformis]MDQ0513412.1 DNA-binding XRE family transcriptional regulator [Ancylobacter amanitiformis]